tara:strand:- start:2360 stop:3307 length:948 start_codon:yes stop_codon:yes gene_type:complete
MLVTLLESTNRINVKLIVGYSNHFDKKIINILSSIYKKVVFDEIQMPKFSKDSNVLHRHHINASRKIIALRKIFLNRYKENSFSSFIDIDVFFTKLWKVPEFKNADLLLTIKSDEAKYRLNSGVIFLKNNEKIINFLRAWENETIDIISDKEKLKKAISKKNIFGGGDQMALSKILDLKNNIISESYEVNNGLKVKLIPTKIYNACEEKIIPDLAKIIHLKGAFHSLLLEGMPFLSDRRESHSVYQINNAYYLNEAALSKISQIKQMNKTELQIYKFKKPAFLKNKNYEVKFYFKIYYKIITKLKKYINIAFNIK